MQREVVIDPVTGEYVVMENGVEVERINPLALLAAPGAPATDTTTIGLDGKAVPLPSAAPPLDPVAAPPATAAAPAAPTDEPWYDSGGSSGGGGYRRSANSGWSTGGYGGSSGGGGATDPFGGYQDDPFAALPAYANGQRHPAAGGAPLVPGGQFAAQDDGFDDRQQVRVPGGATAGPFEVSAAPLPQPDYYAGAAEGGGGGGDSLAQSMIGRIRANVQGRIGGMGPGGNSGGYTTDQEYRRQGRRLDHAYDRYNEALADPEPLPVRGWAKEQGFKPGTVGMFLDNPAQLLPAVFPGFHANQFTDSLTDLPMTDLALIAGGTQGRGLLSPTPVVTPPHILREQGVKPSKPEYKRSLDPGKTANRIAEMYRELGSDGTTRLDTDALLGNLATAQKKSALRQGLEQQFAYDPGEAMRSIGSYVHSAFAGMGNSGQSRALDRSIERRLIEMGPQIARLKPKRASRAINMVAEQFLS